MCAGRFIDDVRKYDERAGHQVLGVYSHGTQRVLLWSERAPTGANVLRHELCHALGHQEPDLVAEIAPELDGLAHIVSSTEDEESAREEAFALLCEVGPEIAGWLAESCPGDREDLSGVMTWMSDRVWSAREEDAMYAGLVLPEARWTTGIPLADLDDVVVLGRMRDETRPLFKVATLVGDEVTDDYADPYTAQLVAFDPFATYSKVPNEIEAGTVFAFDGGTVEDATGYADGPVIARATMRLPMLGRYERLTIRQDGTDWARLSPGCVTEPSHLTLLDGRVWQAWAEDGTVAWVGYGGG